MLFSYCIVISHLGASEPTDSTIQTIHETLKNPYIYQSVNVITGEYCESQTDLLLGGPHPLLLKRCYSSADSIVQGWHFNHPNIPVSLSNYPKDLEKNKGSYTFDNEGRLKQIRSGKGDCVFRSIHFNYSENCNGLTHCSAESEDGSFAHYTFSKLETSRSLHPYLLQQVSTSTGKQISYAYRSHPRERAKLISKREEPLGRYISTEYYDSFVNDVGGTLVKISDPNRDTRIGKVKLQRAPVGPDEKPIITSRFFYNQGTTEVYDALENKTVYRYGKNKKLCAIENYMESGSLYRTENFFWDSHDQLISRAIKDSEGVVHYCQTFAYDTFGNVVRQTIFGDLTGTSTQNIILDENGQPQDSNIESYTTLFRYSDDDKHLLLFQKEDNGGSIRYCYHEDTNKIFSKLTYDKDNLRIRQFFHYDELGNLTTNIIDDGISEYCDDLNQVTERRISRFFPKHDSPGRGLPEIVEEKYLDLAKGVEVLLKRTLISYSAKGEITSETIFDARDNHQYTLTFDYDEYGRLIQSTDANGKTKCVSYDILGNPIQISEGEAITLNTYDFSNRLIRTEKTKGNSALECTTFRYDYAGNQIASIDFFGNETIYEYDALGRLIKTTYPLVSDQENNGVRPTILKTYDIMDRITSITDPNGHSTVTKYNVRGKPTEVIHADGSIEKYEYNLDGTLKKMTSHNGIYVVYERDYLSRVISEQQFSPNGELINSIIREYSAFHLSNETNHSGKIIQYEYDSAGNQIATIQDSGFSTKYTKTSYDTMGQVISRTEWYGSENGNCLTASIERNENNQISAFSIQNTHGDVLKRNEFNQVNEPQDKPYLTYNYNHYNQFQQNVLQTLTTDKNGITTTTTHDSIGRPVKIEKTSSLGDLIQSKEICYDAAGNKVKEIHHILGTNESTSPYICTWSYGPANRIESFIEGFGSENSKITFFSYYPGGNLESITKPDGVILSYLYSITNKPLSLQSSDGTIDYTFHYDHLDRLSEVKDHIHQTTTIRKYNEESLVAYEKLGNGLSLSNKYDPFGRRIELTLPDCSQVKYHYDAAYLRSIERISTEGVVLYTHSYTDYSLNGKLQEEQLIGNLGTLIRTYDEETRLKSIESIHWTQKLERNKQKQICTAITEDPSGINTASYEYDDRQQLTKESSLERHEFHYDSVHNRTNIDEAQIQFNALGQLILQGDKRYTYDLNGNLISISDSEKTISFEYDALNRMINTTKDNDQRITYLYDSFNRRLSSTNLLWSAALSKWEAQETKLFLYDDKNEIGATDKFGIINQLRILGVGLGAEIGAAIALELDNVTYAPIHDHRGSVCCLIDIETGTPIEWSRYSAFGSEKAYSAHTRGTGNPWKFSSKRVDTDTGLIFFGQRYYNPEIGRWMTKDPLGTPESINRYAYNLNDPINRIDPQGLYSLSDIWNTVWDNIQAIYEFTSHNYNTFLNNVSFTRYMRPTTEKVAQFFFGKSFLLLSGFYNDSSETGIHGKGEISDKVRITLTNGILNCRSDFKKSVDLVSEMHGGANIHYMFDATDGWCWDMLKAFFVKCGYISPQAHTIANTWKQMIEEMGGVNGGGIIYHYAHSIGGTHTQAALRIMTPEEKSMIRIFTFGSPSMINDEHLNGIFNFVSVRDGICFLDPIRYISGLMGLNENIIPIGDWLGVPLVDHLFEGTYMDIIKILGHHFLKIYVTGQDQ